MIFKGVKCKNLNHLTQKCLHLSTNAPKSIVQLSIGERNQKLKRDYPIICVNFLRGVE